jgi:phage terminase large subunit-like protein
MPIWTDHPAHRYAVDVTLGKVTAPAYVIKACDRYLRDLDESDDTGMEFRPKTAAAYCQFFPTALKHYKSGFAGQPFELLPWQQFAIWNLFGWFNPDGTRRFHYALILISRKNGKTTLAAGIGLCMMVFDREPSPEVYFAATKRDQSRIAFRDAANMGSASAIVKQYLKVGATEIRPRKGGGQLTYLGANHDSLDGLNTHLAVIDEYHAHPNDHVFNVLKSSQGQRPNALHLTITTEGFNLNGPLTELKTYCRKVLDGTITDDAQFALLYELDEGDDWKNEATWIKANPSLHDAMNLDEMRREFTQAVNQGGSKEVEFKTKRLNLQVYAAKTWIPDEIWVKGERDLAEFDTRGKCWAGLDLASISDMTALVQAWPVNGGYFVRGHYFMPSDTVREVLMSNPAHPYRHLSTMPNAHITDGNVTDYASIRRVVTGVQTVDGRRQERENCLMSEHHLQKIAFDRFNSTQIAIDLTDDGAPLVPFGQGFVSMSAPTKQLELLARKGKIWHDGDPIMRWALSNVAIRTDPAGNIKPDKQKSGGKIDPVVALVMAIGEHMKSGHDVDLSNSYIFGF